MTNKAVLLCGLTAMGEFRGFACRNAGAARSGSGAEITLIGRFLELVPILRGYQKGHPQFLFGGGSPPYSNANHRLVAVSLNWTWLPLMGSLEGCNVAEHACASFGKLCNKCGIMLFVFKPNTPSSMRTCFHGENPARPCLKANQATICKGVSVVGDPPK